MFFPREVIYKKVYLFDKNSLELLNQFNCVKDAAGFLDVSSNDVYGYIHSGRSLNGRYLSYNNVWSDKIETFF